MDQSGTQELLKICAHSTDPLRAQSNLLILAKKLAVDCARFKDKDNDIGSIQDMNNQLTSALLSRRDSVQDIDGNKYES